MNQTIKEKLENAIKKDEKPVKIDLNERNCPFCEQNCTSNCALFFIESKDQKGKCSILKLAICIDAITYNLLRNP